MNAAVNRLRAVALGLLVAALLLPLLPLALWSIARNWTFPHVLPQGLSTGAWRALAAESGALAEALTTTLVVAVGTTLLALLVGLPAGRALGLHRFRGRGLVEVLLMAPLLVPGIAVAMGLHGLLIGAGLASTPLGVMLAHLVPALPYVVLVGAAAFANFDRRLEDQARSLGATPWQVAWHVTLPAVLPGVVLAALLAFLVSWSQYVLTLLVGGGRVVTLPLLLFSFVSAGRHDMTGALALVYVLPAVVAMIFVAGRLTGRAAGGASLPP